jgi:hypothetical protein
MTGAPAKVTQRMLQSIEFPVVLVFEARCEYNNFPKYLCAQVSSVSYLIVLVEELMWTPTFCWKKFESERLMLQSCILQL